MKDRLQIWDITDFYEKTVKGTLEEERELFLRVRLEYANSEEYPFIQRLLHEFYFGASEINSKINNGLFPLNKPFSERFPTLRVTRVYYDAGHDSYENFRFPALLIGFIPQDSDGKYIHFSDALKKIEFEPRIPILDFILFEGSKKTIKKSFLSYVKIYFIKLIENSNQIYSPITVKCKLQKNILSNITGLSETEILNDNDFPELDEKCYMLMKLGKAEDVLMQKLMMDPSYKLTVEDKKLLQITEKLLS